MSEKLLTIAEWKIPIPPREKLTENPIESRYFTIIHNNTSMNVRLLFFFYKYIESKKNCTFCSVQLTGPDNKIDYDINVKCSATVTYTTLLSMSMSRNVILRKGKLGSRYDESRRVQLFSHRQLFESSELEDYTKGNFVISLRVEISSASTSDQMKTSSQSYPRYLGMGQILVKPAEPKKFKAEDLFEEAVTIAPDVILRTADGAQLKAYKKILAEKSTVFAAMFANEMWEKLNGFVDIIDFSGAAMKEFLRFISIGEVKDLEIIARELFDVAKVYQVPDLVNLCFLQLTTNLGPSNALEMAVFADLYDCKNFFVSSCEFIDLRRFSEIKESEEWKTLSPQVQSKILLNLVEKPWILKKTVDLDAPPPQATQMYPMVIVKQEVNRLSYPTNIFPKYPIQQ